MKLESVEFQFNNGFQIPKRHFFNKNRLVNFSAENLIYLKSDLFIERKLKGNTPQSHSKIDLKGRSPKRVASAFLIQIETATMPESRCVPTLTQMGFAD